MAHGGTHKGVSSRGINPCATVNIYIGRARGEDTDPTYIYLLQIIFTQVRCDLVFLEVDCFLYGGAVTPAGCNSPYLATMPSGPSNSNLYKE